MIQGSFSKHTFQFRRPAGTSRGILTEKHAWYLELVDSKNPTIIGKGECSIIPGLSPDFIDFEQYETKLYEVCKNPFLDLTDWPSIKFGVETALKHLAAGGSSIIFDNSFSRGERKLPINGLIWMGDADFMREQIEEKLVAEFKTIKLKIGAIDFDTEIELLNSIRNRFSKEQITLRVDANGAFSLDEAPRKLQQLADLDIHSIEQPIAAGQIRHMSQLCSTTPLPIALDEELIGVNTLMEKIDLLETIRPQYIILKPSLHGGISGTQEWISLAEERSIPWWITSALESNLGLGAICQLAGEYSNELPQGLGTGSLYVKNSPTNLVIEKGEIFIQ